MKGHCNPEDWSRPEGPAVDCYIEGKTNPQKIFG